MTQPLQSALSKQSLHTGNTSTRHTISVGYFVISAISLFQGSSRRAMAPNRRKVVGSRHLVCGNCASWIQHENSGCEKKWADTRVEGFVFTCKGCTDVAALAKEVEGLRQMVEDMKEMVAGQRFEDKGAETVIRVTTTGVNKDREEAAGKIRTEEMITCVEDEGEIRTEEWEGDMCWGNAYGNPHIHEEPREPSRKGDRSTAMGHTHLQGRTRRERTLEASRRQTWTSRIRSSGVPGDHPRHDSRGG